jgi:hypothetical protein
LHHYCRHSTAKLLHGLVNTNRQNFLYYQQSPLCPICQQVEETLQHVFTCSHHDAVNNRQASLDDLERTLHSIDTPQTIIAAITYGFENWCRAPSSQHIRALTAGSLRGPDAVLTSAFHEQVREIGWYHFCLGRISNKWSSAHHQFSNHTSNSTSQQWSSLLITALWRYSRALWNFRNTVVHGVTIKEQVRRRISTLHLQIEQHYAAYIADNSYVLPRHHPLFNTRTVEECKNAPYESMAAWL